MTSSERPLRRNEARLLTRHRLIAACRQLLTETGPENLSTVSITRKAGVAQATFYVHFRDMNEIIGLVAGDIAGQVGKALMRIRAGLRDDVDPIMVLRDTYALALDAVYEQAALVRLLMSDYYRANSVLGDCARRLLEDMARQLFEDLRPLPITAGLDDAWLRQGSGVMVTLAVHLGLQLAEGVLTDRDMALEMLIRMTLAMRR